MTVFATAQEIISAALQELGLGAVNLADTTNNEMAYQMLGTLNALGDEILRVNDWQNLEKIMTFEGDGVTSSFSLPVDFGRQVNQTEWSVSNRRPLIQTSPQTWSWCQYGIVSTGIFYRYRILDGEYAIFPIPASNEEFALYYITKNWVYDPVNLVYKDKVTLSTDVPQFDRRIMITGLKVKFWAQKGFETTQLVQEFDYMVKSEKGQNAGAPILQLSRGGGSYLVGWGNITDGNWNQ